MNRREMMARLAAGTAGMATGAAGAAGVLEAKYRRLREQVAANSQDLGDRLARLQERFRPIETRLARLETRQKLLAGAIVAIAILG